MLLLPIGLLFLQLWAGLKLVSAGTPYSATSIILGAIAILAAWMMLLIVGRASLHGCSGLDLLRPDRLALMLLVLQAGFVIVTNLVPAPQGWGWQVLVACVVVVVELLWTRATLLLSVSWAIGVEMTFAQSWKRLRGNFLRILGLGFLAVMVVVVLTLTCAYCVHESLGLPFPTIPPLAEAILLALVGPIGSAVQCAIYRQLVMEPSSPIGTMEPGTVAA